jgi:hypothetical protein
MWFRGQFVPILYGSSRKDVFGSEVWVCRSTIQRIGAILFATVFLGGGIALLFTVPAMRVEIAQATGDFWGQVFGIALAVPACLVACTAILLALRLV